MTDHFDRLEQSIENGIDLINENGGFTVIGWYKRGQVQDRTVLVQTSNDSNAGKFGVSNPQNVQVDNSQIKYHPCIIRPTNKNFYDATSEEYKNLRDNKFNTCELMDTV